MILHGLFHGEPTKLHKKISKYHFHIISTCWVKQNKFNTILAYEPLCGAGLLAWPWTPAGAIWRISNTQKATECKSIVVAPQLSQDM